MKINGINCTDYAAGSTLKMVLTGTTTQEVKCMQAPFTVYADNGTAVEVLSTYDQLQGITENLISGTITAEFAAVDKNAAEIEALRQANAVLQTALEETTAKATMLEECVVEMASIVYA